MPHKGVYKLGLVRHLTRRPMLAILSTWQSWPES